jgi:hypothetical protein
MRSGWGRWTGLPSRINTRFWRSSESTVRAGYDYLYPAEELEPWVTRIKNVPQAAEDTYAVTNSNLGEATGTRWNCVHFSRARRYCWNTTRSSKRSQEAQPMPFKKTLSPRVSVPNRYGTRPGRRSRAFSQRTNLAVYVVQTDASSAASRCPRHPLPARSQRGILGPSKTSPASVTPPSPA